MGQTWRKMMKQTK